MEPKYLTQEEINAFENPPIGTPVQWFHQADQRLKENEVKAAIVTSHEGPGIVSLTVLGRVSNPQFRIGVRYIGDPFHKDMREMTMTNGGWGYVPGLQPRRQQSQTSVQQNQASSQSSQQPVPPKPKQPTATSPAPQPAKSS